MYKVEYFLETGDYNEPMSAGKFADLDAAKAEANHKYFELGYWKVRILDAAENVVYKRSRYSF